MQSIKKFNHHSKLIKNGWLSLNGDFYICDFGGHSGLLNRLIKKGIVNKNEPMVKLGYYSEGIRKYETAYFEVDLTRQSKLSREQIEFFFKNIDKMKSSQVSLMLDFLKATDNDEYSNFVYYLKFKGQGD